MIKNLKSISPVIATALLLVVAVFAVVGFQNWFGTFSTSLFTKTEQQSSNTVGDSGIENLIGNELYIKNTGTSNITITSVKIDNVDCDLSGNYSNGINSLNVTACVSQITTSTPEVVVYTNTGIYTKKFYYLSIPTQSITILYPVYQFEESLNISDNLISLFISSYMDVDSLGNIYLVGNIEKNIYNNNTFKLYKFDSNTNKVWNITYLGFQNDFVFKLKYYDENIYLTGYTSAVNGPGNITTYKYNNSGSLIWNKTLNLGANDQGTYLDIDNLGNIYVASTTNVTGFSTISLIKYNNSGSLIWNYSINFSNNSYSPKIKFKNNNLYIVSGDGVNITLRKYDTNGNYILNNTYSNIFDNNIVEEMVVDDSENIYVITEMFDIGYHQNLIKFDSSGNYVWNRSNYDFLSEEHKIILDSNENIYICGTSHISLQQIYLRAYNSNGDLLWNVTPEENWSAETMGHGCAFGLDTSNKLYLLENSYNNTDFNYYLLLTKYSLE